MKSWRQSQILDVIDQEPVGSQESLRQRLHARGINATQATISRDLKELGLVKRAGDGAYSRPGAAVESPAISEQLRRAVASLVRGFERVDPLLIVRTDRGQAQGLAEWIDRAHLTEVAGSLAGDDTILLVCRGADAATTLEGRLQDMVTGTSMREAPPTGRNERARASESRERNGDNRGPVSERVGGTAGAKPPGVFSKG